MKKIFFYFVIFLLGIVIGGYVFRNSLPRSFLSFDTCNTMCYKSKDLIGLLVSIGIQNTSQFIPNKIKETDKTIVIENPFPESKIHFLIFPKKDIKDISQLSDNDKEYLIDAYAVMNAIIQEKKLTQYRIITNGSGYQDITYLHFHLRANE